MPIYKYTTTTTVQDVYGLPEEDVLRGIDKAGYEVVDFRKRLGADDDRSLCWNKFRMVQEIEGALSDGPRLIIRKKPTPRRWLVEEVVVGDTRGNGTLYGYPSWHSTEFTKVRVVEEIKQ